NAFSPNGDGKNDFFQPYFIDPPNTYYIHIYNRWGQMVFESNSVTPGWDGNLKGKAQPVGTFIYYLEYSYTGQPVQKMHGAFELLR
ncbi:MAG TPA: gliding motility-associated C-terminal domain-containing protein, partial [Bacteroidia bacterium]|nr:gliding motility-associated C-terminal domain-containing protein [Bacteroidia bacterium]